MYNVNKLSNERVFGHQQLEGAAIYIALAKRLVRLPTDSEQPRICIHHSLLASPPTFAQRDLAVRRRHGRRAPPRRHNHSRAARQQQALHGRRREPARVPGLGGVLRRTVTAGRGQEGDHHRWPAPRAAAEPDNQRCCPRQRRQHPRRAVPPHMVLCAVTLQTCVNLPAGTDR